MTPEKKLILNFAFKVIALIVVGVYGIGIHGPHLLSQPSDLAVKLGAAVLAISAVLVGILLYQVATHDLWKELK